jgi:pyrroline-5-carboxylate reductase
MGAVEHRCHLRASSGELISMRAGWRAATSTKRAKCASPVPRRRPNVAFLVGLVAAVAVSANFPSAHAQQEREAFALQEIYGQTGILSIKAVDH